MHPPDLPIPICTVCGHGASIPFPAGKILYWRCLYCEATVMDAAHLPDAGTEHDRYQLHENDSDDPAYRQFLSKAAKPLTACLSPGRKGLDFGCGPASAMAKMMSEAGHSMKIYDPLFFPDVTALSARYDFITCTEVAEHFHRPKAAFKQIDGLLRPGGYLVIMTCFQTDDRRFKNWHYRREDTHVVFYREKTFRVIARQNGWDCEIPQKDVVLMQKQHLL
jgi:SAM-dependent methyltransferase